MPSVTQSEYEALANFRYALRQFMRSSEDAALGIGLTPQQHQALLAIKGFPDRDKITVGELAERLQIRHHSAVGLIDRLVAQGLLVREPDTTNRRQVCVSLTARGSELLDQLTFAHRAELQRLGPKLNLLLDHLSGAAADVREQP